MIASTTTLQPGYPARWLSALAEFFDRRRIVLSSAIFIGLIGEDVLTGVKPHDPTDLADPFTVIGLLLVVGGVALRTWAAGTLKKNQALTMTGPYRIIRNPLYVGSFLMALGFCTLIADGENF